MSKEIAISGRRVAITGGARGIGRATAEELSRRGVQVAIGDIDGELARQTAKEIGPAVVAFDLDVTDRTSMDEFVDAAENSIGPLDVFINNAGIMPTVRFLDESPDSIKRQFDINVFGVINGMQAVLPRMISRGSGHVINIASTAGKVVLPGIATYCSTKHAVVGLTDAMRMELRDTPVDLSLVMPVIVRTELTSGVPDTRGLKTLTPEDVASSIVEAIETRKYEVWCPRSMNGLYRTTKLMPQRVTDAIGKLMKADDAMLKGIESPHRKAYLERISEPKALTSGDESEDK